MALRAKIASSTDNRLERVVEEVTVLSPTKQAGPTVDAPNGQLLTSIDGPKSPRVKNKLRTSRIFSACRQHKDSIYSLDHSDNNGTNEVQPAVFPPSPMTVHLGERADYLSEYTRVVGGDVTLRQRDHTTWIQLFSGAKAVKTLACRALLDTGSPASFITNQVWERMLSRGAASADGLSESKPTTWGGFHGVPLKTSKRVRLNVQLWKGGRDASVHVGSPTACLAVYAHVVPDSTMTHAVLLGRDSWSHFPVRKFEDINDTETVVTFEVAEHEK